MTMEQEKQQEIDRCLPAAEREQLNLGYMRLSDSAPLIVAKELGFYEKFGLDVTLHREVSWANIRDKTIAGTFDASQMLAPMPLLTTLGAAGIRAPMITGLVLSLNGNAITLSSALWQRIKPKGGQSNQTAQASAIALKGEIKQGGLLTFATVYSFSTHTLILRKWLQAGGIDPDNEVRIIVLPPEQMVESLAQGIIDGFCAGAPWNSIAVDYGIGITATTGYQVWNNAPEKVLAVLASWHTRHPATHLRLRLALMAACQWLAVMSNREMVIEILSRPEYLNLPVDYLRPSLTGKILHEREGIPDKQSNFHVFSHYSAGFPWRSQAEYIVKQFTPLIGRAVNLEHLTLLAEQCFRTDLYRDAALRSGVAAPDQDYKPEGQHAEPWMLGEEIEIGSDLMMGNDGPVWSE